MTENPFVPTDPQSANKPNIPLIFVALMITMLLASLSQTVLSSALPTIVGELHGVEQMTWVITAYMLASTVMMPVYGKIGDVLGRKPVLIAAILIFVGGGILGGLAQNINLLILARVIQGIGGGGLMILSQAAIADVVSARDRGRYVGILGGVFALSSVAGPLLGGWLTEGPGWRWAFWLNIPLGLMALVAVGLLLQLPNRARSDEQSKHDYSGMALIALATTMVVLIGTWGGSTYAWTSPQIIGLFAGSVIAIIAFVFNEKRAAEPIMPLEMFREKNFNLTTIAGLLTAVVMFGTISYIPTYLQMAEGYDATKAGLLMIPMMGALMSTSIVIGNLVSRTGRTRMFPIVGTIVLAGGVFLLSRTTIDTPIVMICISLAVMGIGLGASMQVLTLVVQNAFPHRMVGTATAANNYFRQVGGSVGAAVVGSVFATNLTRLIAEKLPEGTGSSDGMSSLTPALVKTLPDAIRIPVIEAYNEALMPIIVFLIPLALVSTVLLWFVEEKELATTIEKDSASPAATKPLATGSVRGAEQKSASASVA